MTPRTAETAAPISGAAAPQIEWGIAYRTDLDASGVLRPGMASPAMTQCPARLARYYARQTVAYLRAEDRADGRNPHAWHLVHLDPDGTWRVHTDHTPGDTR